MNNKTELREMNPFIINQDGDPIPILKDITTIGRRDDADIVIKNPSISRKHAEIIKQADKLVLKDLNSTNGTFVNGKDGTAIAQASAGAGISSPLVMADLQGDGLPEIVLGINSGELAIMSVDTVPKRNFQEYKIFWQ